MADMAVTEIGISIIASSFTESEWEKYELQEYNL